eukprot:scaffold7841_cov128-Isochrysis_galbana.AAC.3
MSLAGRSGRAVIAGTARSGRAVMRAQRSPKFLSFAICNVMARTEHTMEGSIVVLRLGPGPSLHHPLV